MGVYICWLSTFVDTFGTMRLKSTPAGANKRPAEETLDGSRPLIKLQNSQQECIQTNICILNCRGVITQPQNKCQFLKDEMSETKGRNVIVSLTETWLKEPLQTDPETTSDPETITHTDSEITSFFKDYHIVRADRDISRAAYGVDSEKEKWGGYTKQQHIAYWTCFQVLKWGLRSTSCQCTGPQSTGCKYIPPSWHVSRQISGNYNQS